MVLSADQIAKAWATRSLPPAREVTVVPGWVSFRLMSNTGVSFSLLRGHNLLFTLASVLIVLAVVVILVRGYVADLLGVLALGAVAGGAAGNLLDRLRLGAVVDFIQIRPWPTDFNLADAAIRLGVVAFLIALALGRQRRNHRAVG